MQYDIVFDGTVAPGKDVQEVKKKLAALFKIDMAKAERLFTGKPVFIKKNVDFEEASRYWEIFDKVGAVCKMEPIKEETDQEPDEDDDRGKWY